MRSGRPTGQVNRAVSGTPFSPNDEFRHARRARKIGSDVWRFTRCNQEIEMATLHQLDQAGRRRRAMLAIAAAPEQQLDWNLKALAAADAAKDPRARGWRGSLLHNVGWTMHERGDYAAALAYWQQALAVREAAHDVARTRTARWTVARGLRSLGRLDEAEAMQRALADELQAADAPDGYIFEELAEIALARGDRDAAKPWAAKAYALLSEDADLRANDPARLARLAELAGEKPQSR